MQYIYVARRQIEDRCSLCSVYILGISFLRSTGLPYIHHFASVTGEFVDSTPNMVLGASGRLWFRKS